MTNLETAVAVLERHREARRWDDRDVAADLLAQLGLDPAGDVGAAAEAMALVNKAKAEPVVPPPAIVPGPVIDAPWMPEDNAVEPVGGTSGMIEALPPVAAETHE